ncbi:MAG: efflux RND transporter periplasmic adaptor subunit [Bacteroidales bacterium]|nr:efflux RND transporter periplasmic adaptor subunit [Bacteroidales bacterium]
MDNKLKHFAIILIVSLLGACASKQAKQEKQNNEEKAFNVKIEKVTKQKIEKSLTFSGNIESWEKVHLVPTSPGKIEKLFVDVGSVVNKGDLIAEMDPTQYMTTKLQLLQLEKDFKRMDSLYKLQAISQQQYEQIKTNYEVTKNSYAFIEKNVYLKSPISGIVTAKYYNEGEMFSAAPNTKEGKAALVTIEQISAMKLNIDMPEKYYAQIKSTMPVKIMVDALPNKVFDAKINRIYPVIDPISKTFRVELQIPNYSQQIKPGMFANAKLTLGEVEVTVVPTIAIQKLQGTARFYVFKVQHNTAQQIFVQHQLLTDELSEIYSDELHEGDSIVVVGQEKLVDGSKINIVKQ